MSKNIEVFGLHTPRDELTALRKELMLLGAYEVEPQATAGAAPTRLAEDVLSNEQMMKAADPWVKVDAERYATMLELQHEIEQQRLMEHVRVDLATREEARQRLFVEEQETRSAIVNDWSADLSGTLQRFLDLKSVIADRDRRNRISAAQRAEADLFIEHTKYVVELDREFLCQEAIHSNEVSKERECARKLAEQEMRLQMRAQKSAILPEADLPSNIPFILTSFERFIPRR